MANFDSVFAPSTGQSDSSSNVAAANASTDMDLGAQPAEGEQEAEQVPPFMSSEQFANQYPDITCSVTVNMGGQAVTCHYVDNKCFLTCGAKFKIPCVMCPDARPIFLYAGGSWISDSSKAWIKKFKRVWTKKVEWQAKDFLSKEANINKAVEFRVEDPQGMDPERNYIDLFMSYFYLFLLISALGSAVYLCLFSCSLRWCLRNQGQQALLTAGP